MVESRQIQNLVFLLLPDDLAFLIGDELELDVELTGTTEEFDGESACGGGLVVVEVLLAPGVGLVVEEVGEDPAVGVHQREEERSLSYDVTAVDVSPGKHDQLDYLQIVPPTRPVQSCLVTVVVVECQETVFLQQPLHSTRVLVLARLEELSRTLLLERH